MTPEIAYARTADGLNIAYWSLGSGPPLVLLPTFVSDASAEWSSPRRYLYERLAEHFTLVKFDARGQGLSDRKVAAVSLSTAELDLGAVMDAAGFERADLLAQLIGGPAAISFTSRYPERVSHLVLWHAFARLEDYFGRQPWPALKSLAVEDWDLFTLTISHARVGWRQNDLALQLAEILRRGMEPAHFQVILRDQPQMDATACLGAISVPTLVLHERNAKGFDVADSLPLATAIPGARLHLVDSRLDADASARNGGSAIAEIERFLGVSAGDREGQGPDLTAREVEILASIGSGRSNKEIATRLGLSVHTVERHIATIYAKIGVHNRGAAVLYAIQRQLTATGLHDVV